jgi:hypothetical protein
MPTQTDKVTNMPANLYRHQTLFEAALNYSVSDIMERLDIGDADEIAHSVERALQACGCLHIPLDQNFKKVYLSDGKNMIADWKISPLACYLIVINCNPGNERVAKAQLYFAINTIARKS